MVLKLILPVLAAMPAMLAPIRSRSPFISGHPDDVVMVDAPINPDWIVSGAPVAKAGRHSTAEDGLAVTQIWECTAGSFNWTFYEEETIFILDGSVRVTTSDGQIRVLNVGDVAYFAPRSTALWEIDTFVRKIAFCRTTGNPAVNALRTMLGRMKRSLIG